METRTEPLAVLATWTGPRGVGKMHPPRRGESEVVRAWERSRAAQWHPPRGVAVLHSRN